jgi:hypothetical protein
VKLTALIALALFLTLPIVILLLRAMFLSWRCKRLGHKWDWVDAKSMEWICHRCGLRL